MHAVVQRWFRGRDSYRPAGEPIRTAEYDVAELADDRAAKAFVLENHYCKSFPEARWRFGLFHHGRLVGVAVFSHPVNDRVLTNVFGGAPTDSTELGRFVLLDEVPANAESWMMGRCFRLLRREGRAGVLAFSDPCRRLNRWGVPVFGGHVGTIYQAHNAAYLGRSKARTLRLLPDGVVFSDRAIQKVRGREQGWQYAVAQLVRHGADPDADFAEEGARRAWLARWLALLTRPLRHWGNHRYAWTLSSRVKLPPGLPYPKQVDGEAGPGHPGSLV
jgi:hypothetical protein